jgi:SAM-dependent methyltransferase
MRSHDPNLIARSKVDWVFQQLQEIQLHLSSPLSQASVLVFGCGYRYPEVVILSSMAERTVGIDIIQSYYRDGLFATFKDIHRKERTLPSILKTLLYTYESIGYFEALCEAASITPKSHAQYELRTYDGTQMPFGSQTFDLVISNSVLEHVEKLDVVIREIARVTKKGGLSFHVWHNFYSYSGGHAPEPMCRKYPWGHLRGKYNMPFLNEATPTQISEIFSRYFEEVHWRYDFPEQASLLDQYLPQLPYPHDLLLHKSCILKATAPLP